MQEQSPSPIIALLSEFNTKIQDIEEKQRLIKERVLLIGENLIGTKEDNIKEISELKVKAQKIESDIDRMKDVLSSILEETKNFARKSELEILYRQFKMFQPLLEKNKDKT